MNPLLTVGLPVYNGMPHLPETMESLLHQRFQNFKILIINDGSTDGSLEYLQSLRDPRIRLISQQNRRLTGTLNRMLREIDTPWLVRHDADDIALPDRLGELHRLASQRPQAGLLYSRAVHYQDGRMLMELQTTIASPEGLRKLTRAGHLLSICHSSVALNARKLLDIGGYRFDLYVEDYDMYWRMALATDLYYIDKVLIAARTGSRGVSGTNIGRQAVNMLWVQYLLCSEILGLKPLSYEQVSGVLEQLLPQGIVEYRFNMRCCLDSIGDQRYLVALGHLAQAAVSSPGAFLNRLTKIFPLPRKIVLGINPNLLHRHRAQLWPQERSSKSALDALTIHSSSITVFGGYSGSRNGVPKNPSLKATRASVSGDLA